MVSRNIYRLPFSEKVYSPPQPAPFHDEIPGMKYALDFALPNNTCLVAATDGLVFLVQDGFSHGGANKSLAEECNLVILKHALGEYTLYVHLAKDIPLLKGQPIKQGEFIGYSGLTGYTTYPHLHFAVMKKSRRRWRTIIPRFKKRGRIFTLESPRA